MHLKILDERKLIHNNKKKFKINFISPPKKNKKKMKSIIAISMILALAASYTLPPHGTVFTCDCTASVDIPGDFYALGECAQDNYGDLYEVNAVLESETINTVVVGGTNNPVSWNGWGWIGSCSGVTGPSNPGGVLTTYTVTVSSTTCVQVSGGGTFAAGSQALITGQTNLGSVVSSIENTGTNTFLTFTASPTVAVPVVVNSNLNFVVTCSAAASGVVGNNVGVVTDVSAPG